MIKAITFKPGHLDFLEPHPLFAGEQDLLERTVNVAQSSVNSLTLLWEGKVLAVVGFQSWWRGVAEFWSVSSHYINKCPKSYISFLNKLIEIQMKAFNLTRAQIGLSHNFQDRAKWANLLGFEYEATLKKYGPDGSDQDIYVRFSSGN